MLLRLLFYNTLFFLFFTTNAQTNAQQLNSGAIKWGLKAGVAFTTISGGPKTTGTLKLLAGAFAEYPYNEIMSISIELLGTGAGAVDATQKAVKGQWRYVYLNTPVLVKLYLFANKAIDIHTGIQPGFLLDARYTNSTNKYAIANETRKLDIALPIGVGFQLTNNFIAQCRATLGLRDHSLRNWSGDKYRNNTIQLALAYSF